jgi:hypothetical protein
MSRNRDLNFKGGRFQQRHSLLSIAGLLVLFLFCSCRYFKKEDKAKANAVARAYDKYIYADDLKGIVPANSSKQDSAVIAKNYIDNWIHQQAVLHKAEKNLDNEKKDVEKQLEEYRNSLVRYAYEKELIQQRLDTNVSDKEIETFFNSNPDNFQLKSNILRVILLKLNKKSPKLDKARQWYKSENAKDRELLTGYAHQYAINFYLDDNTWLQFDDLLKEIPIKTYDQEQFLHNNRNIEVEDSTDIYLISIKSFKIKNSLSPLSFEKNNIRAMLINQRKLKLIEQMEKQAYDDAQNNGDVEILKGN